MMAKPISRTFMVSLPYKMLTQVSTAFDKKNIVRFNEQSLTQEQLILDFLYIMDNYLPNDDGQHDANIVALCTKLLAELPTRPLPSYILLLIDSVIHHLAFMKSKDEDSKKALFAKFTELAENLIFLEKDHMAHQRIFPSYDKYYLYVLRVVISAQYAAMTEFVNKNGVNTPLPAVLIEKINVCRSALESFIKARSDKNDYLSLGAKFLFVRLFYSIDLAGLYPHVDHTVGAIPYLNAKNALNCIFDMRSKLLVVKNTSVEHQCFSMHLDIYQLRIALSLELYGPQTSAVKVKKLELIDLANKIEHISVGNIIAIIQATFNKPNGIKSDYLLPIPELSYQLVEPMIREYTNLLSDAETWLDRYIKCHLYDGGVDLLKPNEKYALLSILMLRQKIYINQLDLISNSDTILYPDKTQHDMAINRITKGIVDVGIEIKALEIDLAKADAAARQAIELLDMPVKRRQVKKASFSKEVKIKNQKDSKPRPAIVSINDIPQNAAEPLVVVIPVVTVDPIVVVEEAAAVVSVLDPDDMSSKLPAYLQCDVLDKMLAHNETCKVFLVEETVINFCLDKSPKTFKVCTSLPMATIQSIFGDLGLTLGYRPKYIIQRNHQLPIEISSMITTRMVGEPSFFYTSNSTYHHELVTDDIDDNSSGRGLTCLALYFDCRAKRMIDPTRQARADIQHRKLVFLGDPLTILKSDPRLVLYAIRLMVEHGFQFDTSMPVDIMRCVNLDNYADKGYLYHEMSKMLSSDNAQAAFRLLRDYHLLTQLYHINLEANKPYLDLIESIVSTPELRGNSALLWMSLLAKELDNVDIPDAYVSIFAKAGIPKNLRLTLTRLWTLHKKVDASAASVDMIKLAASFSALYLQATQPLASSAKHLIDGGMFGQSKVVERDDWQVVATRRSKSSSVVATRRLGRK